MSIEKLKTVQIQLNSTPFLGKGTTVGELIGATVGLEKLAVATQQFSI